MSESCVETIRSAVAALLKPESVVELRVLGPGRYVESGYYDDHQRLAADAAERNGRGRLVCVTLNPVNPALLARTKNRLVRFPTSTTADADVICRRWLLIDLDPCRPAGISATSDEHDAALERARDIRAGLRSQGWPDPLIADSGNGAHVLYRIDLPNDSSATPIVRRCLEAIALRFSDDQVEVDLTTYNAARLAKAYGTTACKGEDVPERPHRVSQIVEMPDRLEVVGRPLLDQLAAQLPQPTKSADTRFGSFDLESWITKYNLPIVSTGSWKGGRKYILNPCLWNPEHDNRAAYIVQVAGGAIAAGCHHNGCAGKDWHSLRDLVEPGWKQRGAAARGGGIPSGAGFNLTDVGNAHRFIAQHGSDLRYVHQWGNWLVWDGMRWAKDENGEIERRAKKTARSIYAEAAKEEDEKRRKQIVGWARSSESERRINAMISLARSESEVALCAAQLDADQWKLNVLNGTLDLRTGDLKPHDPQDLITKLAPVAYDKRAKSELWDSFIERVHPDPMVRAFLQRAAGYSLTGSVAEEVMFFGYGPAATGKTTFSEAMKGALGDYAATADFEAFLHRRDVGGPRNDVARLAGKRFVASQEVDEGKRLAEGLVKSVTGGDVVTARFLYKEAFEFRPTFKLWLFANHRPRVRDDDDAMWRRIHLVPFDVEIPKEERDPGVKETLRDPQKAGPAILAWLVQGCLEWQERGLDVPFAVQAATQEYRDEMDPLGDWLEENCDVGTSDLWEFSSNLWESYHRYAGHKGLGRRAFQNKLTEHGFETARASGGACIRKGIRLRDATDVTEG